MEELKKKIDGLKKANPNITDETICLLLGITKEELAKVKIEIPDMFKEIFGAK